MGPDCLNAHSGAWDSRRRAALIFGGADDRSVLNRLWQFRGGRWQLLSQAGPEPRTFPAVSYDSSRDRLIVFGGSRVLFGTTGQADPLLDDHWEWDGRQWHRLGGPRPPGRTEAGLAFDPIRRRTVLFGGWRWQGGQRVRLADIWEFDGSRWMERAAPGPDARSGVAAAWSPVAGRMVVLGGNGPRADAWGFDGTGWLRLPDLPQARFNAAMAFDRAGDRMVVFGGWTGRERLAATLTLTERGWHAPQGAEPSPRNHSLLVPVGSGDRLLLIGGHDGERVFGDQWVWDGRWRPLQNTPPKRRVDNGH